MLATRRLNHRFDALLTDPRPGSEADTGELLEARGVFDVPATLTETDRAVIDLFLIAIDAVGGIRHGHRHGLDRWFTTGDLTAAHLSLAATRSLTRTGHPARYWTGPGAHRLGDGSVTLGSPRRKSVHPTSYAVRVSARGASPRQSCRASAGGGGAGSQAVSTVVLLQSGFRAPSAGSATMPSVSSRPVEITPSPPR
ncbi:hypothetical protein ACIRS1_31485 [Kitasatospora sp. NPDC101176]|uniref:hypothetical protein n=1 Tax=Kitasatospora sp. NPDC101176 TaxID=3364099 RepID=UPI003807B2F6